MNDVALRRIWLCADDYGISDGVNRAIRELIERGRLNATSVMMVTPAIGRESAAALQASAAKSPRCAIGLHVTLTAPFRPLTLHFRPLDGDMFYPFAKLLRRGLMRRLDAELVYFEVLAQLDAFRELFGRAPDYVDGHQHAQLFPQVRDAFLRAVKERAPQAWVRQCGRFGPPARRFPGPKTLVLNTLSAQFRSKAAKAGLRFNPGFAGAYDFARVNEFAGLMRSFLEGLPEDGLVMCHPGFVDETLKSLDPLTTAREIEHAYLASDDFTALLALNKVTLA